MRMPTKREWALLALVVPVIVLVAAAGQGGDDGNIAIAEVKQDNRTNPEVRHTPTTGDLDLTQLRREAAAAEPGNAFESKSWYVPPPPPPPPPPAPPPKPLPPPVPKAPPLPFVYLGTYQDAAKPVIFLVRGDRVLSVSAGDVIEGTYRVDSIVGATLSLTYLPLNIKQTLNIGTAG